MIFPVAIEAVFGDCGRCSHMTGSYLRSQVKDVALDEGLFGFSYCALLCTHIIYVFLARHKIFDVYLFSLFVCLFVCCF